MSSLSRVCEASWEQKNHRDTEAQRKQRAETGNCKLETCFVVFSQCLAASAVNKNHILLELAGAVIRVTHSKSRTVFEPLAIDDPQRRDRDIAPAREKLEWYRQVCLEKGLVKRLPYFRSLLQETPRTLEPLIAGAAS
jgi:hypothetical protein